MRYGKYLALLILQRDKLFLDPTQAALT